MMPRFKSKALCVESETPDDFFPDRSSITRVNSHVEIQRHSYTESAMRARNLCLNCEAYDECYEYSMRYRDLDGIWANQDYYERREAQRVLGLTDLDSVVDYEIVIPSPVNLLDEEYDV